MKKKFKPGDKVICINSGRYTDTLIDNESYTIYQVNGNYVILVGDKRKYNFLQTRFEFDIKLMRKNKLEQIIKNV